MTGIYSVRYKTAGREINNSAKMAIMILFDTVKCTLVFFGVFCYYRVNFLCLPGKMWQNKCNYVLII